MSSQSEVMISSIGDLNNISGLDADDDNEELWFKIGEKKYNLSKKECEFSELLKTILNDEEISKYNEENPLEIASEIPISDYNMNTIISYIKQCSANGEKDSPKPPVWGSPLQFLNEEYIFYKDILEDEKSSKEEIMERLKSLLFSIHYFGIKKFREKTSAVIASFIMQNEMYDIFNEE